MLLGAPGRPREKLGVFIMALALVLASFLGAALGLVWQSTSFFDDDVEGGADESADQDDGQQEAVTVPNTG